MTNKQINNLYNGINDLKDKKLPIGVSFVLTRNSKILKDIFDDIDESRLEIIRQYCVKDDDGNLIVEENGDVQIPPENVDHFNNDISELLNRDTEITLEKLSMEDIKKCDLDKYDSLTLKEFEVLEQLVEDNNDNEGDGIND